jgi:large subunit ribosomal protein L24
MHVSNLQLICPECTKTGRISMKIFEDGTKVRACKSCGGTIESKARVKY